MLHERDIIFLKKLYKDKIAQYGARPEGACWSSIDSQKKRFEVLVQIDDLRGMKILDFGCGTGALATFLKDSNISVSYYGCDVVAEALNIARNNHPECFFGELNEIISEKFDYIFISGVFNNKLPDNKAYYQDILLKLWPLAKKGIAFNMMSSYVDYFDESLFYESPGEVLDFLKCNISPYVTIRNDYQVKKEVQVPFEFAVYVYRDGK